MPALLEAHWLNALDAQQFLWTCTPHTQMKQQERMIIMQRHYPGARIPCIRSDIVYEAVMLTRTKVSYQFDVDKPKQKVNTIPVSAIWLGVEGEPRKHTYTGTNETLTILDAQGDQDVGVARLRLPATEEVPA